MDLDAALERWRAASTAGNIEAMDEAARAVLSAHDARAEIAAVEARTEARIAIMAAVGEAAGASDKAARDAALADLDPKAREAFLKTAPADGYGEACGLRVRPGPVVLVSYEDSGVRMARRHGAGSGRARGGTS